MRNVHFGYAQCTKQSPHSAPVEEIRQSCEQYVWNPHCDVSRETEIRSRNALYETWCEKSEGERFGTHYQELFMQTEDTLKELMRKDRADGHSRSERGWTPPPKGYVDALADEGASLETSAPVSTSDENK